MKSMSDNQSFFPQQDHKWSTSVDDGRTLHTYKPCRDLLHPRRCTLRLTVLQGLNVAQERMM